MPDLDCPAPRQWNSEKGSVWLFLTRVAGALFCAGQLFLTGCNGPQSALVGAGRASETLLELFVWMVAGAIVIWAVVVALFLFALQKRDALPPKTAAFYIIGGGFVLPTIVLAALLSYGLAILPGLNAPAPEGSLRVRVTGERFWWRVRYLPAEGSPVDVANEIRLPRGEPVEFLLESPDVIHSFWIPSLGGKVDMIPGRQTRLSLYPTRSGEYRGTCAEYCGASHALMSFPAVVEEPEVFEAWLQQQRQLAEAPETEQGREGQRLFLANGCGACHAIRGTEADGTIGPDLTHVGSRLTLGAGVLPNDAAAFQRWIAETHQVKPEAHMPAFGMLSDTNLRAISLYLDGLE